ATVARSYSRGASAKKGGAWGEISRGSLAKRLAGPGEVLFTLGPNEMKVVETEDAVFLVRCGKKTPTQRASFEDAQRAVIDKLVDEQFNRLRSEYIHDLI